MSPVDRLSKLDQIASVREGLKAPLIEGMAWNVISCDWYQRWKLYVNFDNHPDVQGNFPGEILNAGLLAPEEHSLPLGAPRQLRRDCIEGLDFFVLPSKHYQMLKSAFGSDIDIERFVIVEGVHGGGIGEAQLEINPVRLNVFVVTTEEDGCDIALQSASPAEVFHFSRQVSLSTAAQTILDKLALDPPPPYIESGLSHPAPSVAAASSRSLTRFWAKTSTTAVGASPQDNSISSAAATSYSTEITDFSGPYMFLRGLGGAEESEFDRMVLENSVDMNERTLDLIVEVGKAAGDKPDDVTWPRDKQLFRWTDRVQRGDTIGASDEYGSWYEAVVQEVGASHMVVHFKGWGAKFDEKILAPDYHKRLAPCFTKTANWRAALKKGSEVDYSTSQSTTDPRLWLPGIVTAVDDMFGSISLKFKRADNRVHLATDIDLESEQICDKNTHLKSADWTFHHVDPEPNQSYPMHKHATATASAVVRTPPYSYYSNRAMVGHAPGTPVVTGAVGLTNLGNTCFMNSTLQCLSNTPGLTQLFLDDRHVSQVNYDNVLGHKGELANVYAKLIKDMWSNKYTSVRPEDFKRSISEFAPQFSGYQQHDSSELMMFLLDGLHEDMNRVLKKPAVDKIESKGRSDDVISAESWRRYLLRNDSELVDLCFGQLKSHVTCAGCGYESVTFDEYSSLSLPLPLKTQQVLSFTVYPLPLGSRPLRITVSASCDATIEELSALIGADPLFKHAAKSRKRSELGKRKNSAESSYLLVDSDTLDTQKEIGAGDGELLLRSDVVKMSSSYSDIENLGEISINNEQDDAVLVSNTIPEVDKYYFHVCSLFTSYDNPRVQKTYDAKGVIRNASDVVLVAYEMAQPVPTDNYYSSYSSIRSMDKSAPSYTYFDLVVGVQKFAPVHGTTSSGMSSMNPVYRGHTRDLGFKVAGYPIRIAYQRGVTTRAEMHCTIFDAMKEAYDLPDAYSATRLPYVLHLTSSYANMSKGVVDLTDKQASEPFNVSTYEILICCWKPEALPGSEGSTDDDKGGDLSDQDCVSISALDVTPDIPNIDPDMVQRWLDDGINSTSEGRAGSSTESGGMNIMHCFDKFIEREQMPAEETWFCPRCKEHLAPIKKFDLWSAPEILVVHLKRFQYSSRASFTYREKVNDLIDFPIEGLDLSQYVKSAQSANAQTPAIYDLYGVSEHSGTMAGGHYTAKCQNAVDGKWYSFNDSYVTECSAQSAVSSEAYVLFYKRRHGHLKWGGLIPSASPMEE